MMRVDVVTEQTMIYRAEFELTPQSNNVATASHREAYCLRGDGVACFMQMVCVKIFGCNYKDDIEPYFGVALRSQAS